MGTLVPGPVVLALQKQSTDNLCPKEVANSANKGLKKKLAPIRITRFLFYKMIWGIDFFLVWFIMVSTCLGPSQGWSQGPRPMGAGEGSSLKMKLQPQNVAKDPLVGLEPRTLGVWDRRKGR